MVKVKIAGINRGLASSKKSGTASAKGADEKRLAGGWSNIRMASMASYAQAGIQDDDGDHDLWECWCICKYQTYVRRWYSSLLIQVTVAVFIFLNFLVEIANAQAVNDYSTEGVFQFFEWFFTILFTIELAINMFAHWWFRFWQDGWNWFDFIVVGVSLLAIITPGIPGIAVLRLLRAFRVFRLFKRL